MFTPLPSLEDVTILGETLQRSTASRELAPAACSENGLVRGSAPASSTYCPIFGSECPDRIIYVMSSVRRVLPLRAYNRPFAQDDGQTAPRIY